MSISYPATQEERDALRARNMAAFKNHSIATARMLEAHMPATKLVYDEDGQPDVEFQGQKFYDGAYYDYVEKQVEAFKQAPYRFGLAIPQPSDLDAYGETFLTNLLKRATVEAKAEFSQRIPDLKTFFVTVLGVGLGGHIPKIDAFSDATVMFVIDLNIENLYHSLELFDWEKLMDEKVEKGGMVHFQFGDNAVSHFNNIKAHVRFMNTPGIDGMIMFKHYNNAMFTEILREVDKQGSLFLAGLGFYSDETKMLENTFNILKDGKAHIYTRQDDGNIPYPCFIVGCGPSLDSDLEYIRALADKAIVISSGSALGPLLQSGVTPDFQLEVENEGILPIMSHVAKHHDITNICLVTSTTVEPEIVEYFDRIIFHFRPALTPYGLFSDNPKNTIPFHDPSVVNSSFGFALDLGFRDFYFFGCDMGTWDADQHHAKNSYHFEDDAVLPDNDFCIPVPANFGGTTYTSSGLNWVKSSVEMAISQNRTGRRFYNCSDGAFLNGAIAKFSKSLDLPAQDSPGFKMDFVRETYANSPAMNRETFEGFWDRDDMETKLDNMFDEIEDIFSNAAFLLDKTYLTDLNKILFFSKTPTERGIATWVRGTLQMILLAVVFYGNRLMNEEAELDFEEIIREEILSVLKDMRAKSHDTVARLSETM